MVEIVFGPGEEKLETAFKLILGLQQQLMRLSQRGEVDSMLIGLLLSEQTAPEAMYERWQSMVAAYYPERALSHLSQDLMEHSAQELKDRIDFWTRAIQARLPRDED